MCFELEELNVKVLMAGSEMMVGKVVEMGASCGDRGAMKVVWITGGHNCVKLLGPCNRLFLKVHRGFCDNGEGRGNTGEHGQVGV